MARNAAFGRPRVQDRLRSWWYGTSSTARTNALLVVAVCGVAALLIFAATAHDGSRTGPRAGAIRPQLSAGTFPPTTSTTVLGSLFAAGAVPANTDVAGAAVSTTTTVAAAPAAPAAVSAPPARSSPATTTSRSPGTTAVSSEVIYGDAPAATPATTAPPATATTLPTATTTTAAPATPPTTAGLSLPLPSLPPILGPG